MASTDSPSDLHTILGAKFYQEPNIRGTAGLIWTCLLTLVLCIWTTVHPNVPGGKRKWFGWLWVRISWMLMALFAPEIVLYMAWQQRVVANWLTKEIPAVEDTIRKERETIEETKERERKEREADAQVAEQKARESILNSVEPVITDTFRAFRSTTLAVRFVNILGDRARASKTDKDDRDLEKNEPPAVETPPTVQSPLGVETSPPPETLPNIENTTTIETTTKLSEKELRQVRHLKKYTWTQSHSFLLTMGGIAFSTYDKAGVQFIPYRYWATITITGAKFIKMIDPTVLRVPKRYIDDKSKASVFFRLFVIFQTAIFIIQCIVRLYSHLGITPIELNTCMHVICAVIMSCLWWNKPFAVETPFLILDEHGLRLGALFYVIDKYGIDEVLKKLDPDAPENPPPDAEVSQTTRGSMDIRETDSDSQPPPIVEYSEDETFKKTARAQTKEIQKTEAKIQHPYGRLLLDSDNKMNDWKLITTVVSKMSLLKNWKTFKLRRKDTKGSTRSLTWDRDEKPDHDILRMWELAREAMRDRPKLTLEELKRCYNSLGKNFAGPDHPEPTSPKIHPDHEVPQYAAATYELGPKERRMLFIHPILCLFTTVYGAAHIIFIYTQESVLRTEAERLIWVVAASLIAGTSITFWLSIEGIPKLLSGYRFIIKRIHKGIESASEPSTPGRPNLSRAGTGFSFGSAFSRRSIGSNFKSSLPDLTRSASRRVSGGLLPAIKAFYRNVNGVTKRLEEVLKFDLMILLLFYFTACRCYLIIECFYTVFYLPEMFFQQPDSGIPFL